MKILRKAFAKMSEQERTAFISREDVKQYLANVRKAISEKRAVESTPDRIYDLNGRQLVNEPQKGIYVKNGKKIAR